MALPTDDQQLLDYLRGRWRELFRLTTLDQGMSALGQPRDDARRLRVGDYLLAHPASHPAVQRWGARTFILTEGEKLLGRYLGRAAQVATGHSRIPLAGVAAAIGRSTADVQRGLHALQHLVLLEWQLDGGAKGGTVVYALARDREHLAGPLGFTFHTITRQAGERFNVP